MLELAAGLILLGVLGFLIWRWIRSNVRVVPHEQRLVVYRLGYFHRIAGPGLVHLIPGLDRVKGEYVVRDEPVDCAVDEIFIYGVPMGVTIRLWASFDLKKAAGGDQEKLGNFVQFGYIERRRQVTAKVRETLIDQVEVLERENPLPDTASIVERILPLIPGTPQSKEMLRNAEIQLEETLPSVGAVLDITQPVTIAGLSPSQQLVDALERQRVTTIDRERLSDYIDVLRDRLPTVPDAMLAQIVAALDGLDSVKVQTLLLQGEADTSAEIRYDVDEEGVQSYLKPSRRESAEEFERMLDQSSGEQLPLQPKVLLDESDLSVLKRVPRDNQDERSTA